MDKFLLNFDAAELRTASEFLSNWLPFLSGGLCNSCTQILSDRIRSLDTEKNISVSTAVIINRKHCEDDGGNCSNCSNGSCNGSADNIDNVDTVSLGSWKDSAYFSGEHTSEVSSPSETPSFLTPPANSGVKKSWADMAQEDELAEEENNEVSSKAFYANESIREEASHDEAKKKVVLSREQREYYRFSSVKKKKDFICLERVKGKHVNILEGLELHAGVFSSAEQTRIVNFVEELQEMGHKGKLKDRTYSAPKKWMKGKGRITLQFGCCYNYATDKNGNPPGILKSELVDPLPQLFKVMIKRLVRWHILPPSCVPDSCIVNIYEEGDCIPPHIDNHDFVRPFCTVSFLSECEIKFGSNLKILGPGEFDGSYAIPLPVGSVFVLKGNGADIAKHCVPAVPTRRISITFRKMDESKWPIGYIPEPDLQGLQPLPIPGVNNSSGPRRSSGKLSIPTEDRVDRERGYNSRHPDNNGRSDDGLLPLPAELETPKYNNNYSSGPRGRGSNFRHTDNGYSDNGRYSGRGRQGGGFNRQRVPVNFE